MAEIPTQLDTVSTYIFEGLLSEDKTLLLLEFPRPYPEPARSSDYVIIDLKSGKLKCSFYLNKWSYIDGAYFYRNKFLYLKVGRKIGFPVVLRYWVYDIDQGDVIEKIMTGKSPKGRGYRNEDLEIWSWEISDHRIELENCFVTFDHHTSIIRIYSK